ncbi:MAG: serine/threonine protein kinase [Myxococcales bacterium]|nr:serine/threonine protein kinase [Myxococcales bacterium]
MLASAVRDAFARLTQYIQSGEDPAESRASLLAWWKGPLYDGPERKLDIAVQPAAEVLERALPALSRSNSGTNELVALLNEPAGETLYLWLLSVAGRRDVRLAPLLQSAMNNADWCHRIPDVADARVLEGPLSDALACAPLTGPATHIVLPEYASVKARLEILLWEAGASALPMPELAPWVFGSVEDFEALVGSWARGPLRGRVLAARCLEVCARGLTSSFPPDVVGKTLQNLQPLLLHPDPLVWVHAGRALGRFAGEFEALEGTLLDWMRAESPLLRQRAITAFASLPADKLRVYGGELSSMLSDPKTEAYALAAAAAATPYLMIERRDLWDKLAARILSGDGGAITARALARGLGALWRRGGTQQQLVEAPLRQLREMARSARSERLDDWRRWLFVLAATDPIDGAERDPLDLEQGLENLVRLAAQYDDEEADARAARFAESLTSTFNEAKKISITDGRARRRAAGINAIEGIARSLALGLWGPLLATRPAGTPVIEPDLEDTWRTVADAPQSLLETVEERRKEGSSDAEADEALEVLAIQLGGYALDACGEEPDLGPGRGPTAHHTCMWLRKVQGLTDGSRTLSSAMRNALSSLFWRLVDATRGTSLGEVDDVRWLGPFAAWWALVVDRPAVLEQLAASLPMLSKDALERCTILAEEIRGALRSDPQRACDGRWVTAVEQSMIDLEADDTELCHAIVGFAHALQRFTGAAGNKPELDALCLQLALGAERLHASLEDPVKGLHSSPEGGAFESDNAPRVAALVARAIRARDLAPVGVWFGSLGPVTSALVEAAVNGAVRRTPPPPPAPKKADSRKIIEGYELIKPLGEGGIGSVWQVRKPGADRMFVLKIPKADALEGASESEREGILASFVEEAKALAGLYHPNVANIIDRGVSNGVPFLVLELLIGADLKQYAGARLLSLFELRQIVVESCAGLAALHGAGLVHRDIKPANLWIRLPIHGAERFDSEKHRDPARTPVLATVVIDFGMVRATKVSKEAMGRFVAGTPGYIAPEQVLDPMELDGRADVYALAGTIYNVTTGRTFFDDINNPRDRIIAHMQRDPFEDPERLRIFPAAVAKLLRDATTKDPRERPTPLEFGRAFAAAL